MLKVSYDITGLDEIAKLIIAKTTYKTLLFNGEMGAGKTTLITAIEYEYTGDFLFIEWSERIPNLIPEESHIISIVIENNGLRTLEISE